MQITWNSKDFCFELTFDRNNFQECLACAKGAKFKATGAPKWVWYTDKVKNLRFLREHKPSSGLTITEEARVRFETQCVEEDKKDAVLKYARDIKAKLAGKLTEDEKAVKREEREKARKAKGLVPVVRKPRMARGGAHVKVDVQYSALKHKPFVPPAWPTIKCVFCNDPVYAEYEKVDPLPICLWCEKTIADNQGPDVEST